MSVNTAGLVNPEEEVGRNSGTGEPMGLPPEWLAMGPKRPQSVTSVPPLSPNAPASTSVPRRYVVCLAILMAFGICYIFGRYLFVWRLLTREIRRETRSASPCGPNDATKIHFLLASSPFSPPNLYLDHFLHCITL